MRAHRSELPGAPHPRRYLTEWIRTKEERLKPTTFVRYRDYVRADLVPSFGHLALVDLRPRHIVAWQGAELAHGRGRTAVHRIGATLSSALGSAVRARLIADNPCRHAMPPRPAAQERICWNPTQAAEFLRHNHAHYGDQLADLFELLLGTGIRRGDALGLHWTDVHLQEKRPCWCAGTSRPSTTTCATSATRKPRRAGTG